MGMISPKDGTYQPIVRHITRDGRPAHKAEDVIAHELKDGSIVGGEEYQAYDEQRKAILGKLAKDKATLDKKANSELAAAFKTLAERNKEAA